jgi:hypothetical protein
VRYDNIVINQVGDGIGGANIAVCTHAFNTPITPCVAPNVALFKDEQATLPLSNPFQADSLGNYGFFVANGEYTVTVSSPNTTTSTELITSPGGTLALQVNGVPNGSQALLNLAAGSQMTISDNGTGTVTLSASGGGGGGGTPSGATGTYQFNNAGVFGAGILTQNAALTSVTDTGSLSVKGPIPWVDVTAYGADPTGGTDSTAAIQAAINAACVNSAAGGGIVLFPGTGSTAYVVTQAQGGSGSIAPVFNTPCSNLTFRGGGSIGGIINFQRGPKTKIAVVGLGASPSAGPVFGFGANYNNTANPNNGMTLENLSVFGYNQALANTGNQNTTLRNVDLSIQQTGFTGSGTTYTDNVALVTGGFWLKWEEGSFAGNVLIVSDNSGSGPFGTQFENLFLQQSQFHISARQANPSAILGPLYFRNILRENALVGQDFITVSNDTGGACSSAISAIGDITIDHFGDADAAAVLNVISFNANMAGCAVRNIYVRNSVAGNAGSGSQIKMLGGTLTASTVIGSGNGGGISVTDGNGNPTGGVQIIGNANGPDVIVFTGNDDTRGGSIPRRLGTDLFVQGGSNNPPAPGWALTASGNQQRSLAGDPVAGVLFGSGLDYGYTEQIYQATREALDIGFATLAPPSNFAGTATTGGSLAAGTYFYSIRTNSSGNCGTNTADSAPAIITTGIVVGGSNNAVALTWTPVQGTSTVLEYCIQRQTGSSNFFNISTGFQIAAPASSYTDTGANPGPWSGSQIPYTNPMASSHRFTPTSLGIGTTSPVANLDVVGTAHLSGNLFAGLGTPANGTLVYCQDCTITSPCAGSGTGALAKRLNGVWVCN